MRLNFEDFKNFSNIQKQLDEDKPVFICLGKSQHKVKKKAEQGACENALKLLIE